MMYRNVKAGASAGICAGLLIIYCYGPIIHSSGKVLMIGQETKPVSSSSSFLQNPITTKEQRPLRGIQMPPKFRRRYSVDFDKSYMHHNIDMHESVI